MSNFKIISVKQTNPYYDPDRVDNGGGYYQPEYTFVYDGIKGTFEDTSCGDFGVRYVLKWNGLRALRNTVDKANDYSDFSESNPKHVELINILREVTYRYIPTIEGIDRVTKEIYGNIFAPLDIDLYYPVSGADISQRLDDIIDCLKRYDYVYFFSDDIKLNPKVTYQLWLDRAQRFWGFRKITN